MTSRRMRLLMFDCQAPAHLSAGLWRHDQDQGYRYTDLRYFTEYAKLLEQARFDGMFFADAIGYHDVYRGNADAALADAAQTPSNDPLMAVSAMASVTENLCFGVTGSTSYEHPYMLARRFSTLDHLTDGRIGHDKNLFPDWAVAEGPFLKEHPYVPPYLDEDWIAEAGVALTCPETDLMLKSIRTEMDPRRFLSNLMHAYEYTKYRINRVPLYELNRCGLTPPPTKTPPYDGMPATGP